MVEISEIVELLRGKEDDLEAIIPIARAYTPLATKIALLALASEKRLYNPHWIGCPPSIFLSYKWNGSDLTKYVSSVHDYLSSKGYRVYFDSNELDEDAESFTEVPQYISRVADCQYYLLLLTEKTADYVSGRIGKTSWIFDEYQQAISLVNMGRLFIVPVLVEEGGVTDFFRPEMVINLTKNPNDLTPLDSLFYPINCKLPEELRPIYNDFLDACDLFIMRKQWNELLDWLKNGQVFKNFPDYQFRLLIYSICTKNKESYEFSLKYVSDFLPNLQVFRLLKSYGKLYQIEELSQVFK